MKTHVVKTTPDAPLSEAVDLMDIYQVDSLPVVDDRGCLCGIISEQDIADLVARTCIEASSGPSDEASRSTGEALQVAARSVGAVMQPAVHSIVEDHDIASSVRTILANGFTRIPVLTVNGTVIGTLNRIDIIQSMFEGRIEGPP